MPRDPARIEEMTSLVEEVWKLDPDLRLGQLVLNAARLQGGEHIDVGGIEDGTLRNGLRRYRDLMLGKR